MPLTANQAALVAVTLKAFDDQVRFAPRLARQIKLDDTDKADLGWLDSLPGFREFLDERKAFGISDKDYIIQAKAYEETVRIPRKDWKYGRLYKADAMLSQIGADAAKYPDIQIITTLNDSETQLTYDAKALIAEDHPDGIGGNNSNLITGAGVTIDNLKSDWDKACARMRGFKIGKVDQDDVRVFDKKPNGVICPPALERKFKTIFTAETIDQSTNTYAGDVSPENIFVSSQLSDDDDWFPVYTEDPGIKPFALVTVLPDAEEAEGGHIVGSNDDGLILSYLGPKSESAFWKGDVIFSATLDLRLVPWAWFYIVKVKN